MMKYQNVLLFLFGFSLIAFFSCSEHTIEKRKDVDPDQQEMFALLALWCDKLIDYQIHHPHNALDGGVICPACVLMHGRTPDAVYPLLYMKDRTGNDKYQKAAVALLRWGLENVRFADGAWNNEVNMYSWKGTTVFGLISLMETVQDFGHLLDKETHQLCMKTIQEQAAFINDFIKPGVGNINYSATACYALALAGKILREDKYIARASVLALEMRNFFTKHDHLFFGEGAFPYHPSPKGLLPVDLGYNVEETLPNLLYYAELVGDSVLSELVQRSFYTHLEFMLPDGAWDNSWGTRNFKWSYWGSRTSDGFIAAGKILGEKDPVFAEAAYRNFELWKTCTHNGLLQGGVHYPSAGYLPCIQHTFEHAKSLAYALHDGYGKPISRITLPREMKSGYKYLKDLDVWIVSKADWRATITGYDVDYMQPGGNAHGGTLSMLWHNQAGPLLAAAMSEYSLIEPANMQIPKGLFSYSATASVDYEDSTGRVYRNIYFKGDKIEKVTAKGDTETFRVLTELVDSEQRPPVEGQIPIIVDYSFGKDVVTIRASFQNRQPGKKARLYIPLIAGANEQLTPTSNGFSITKEHATIRISSNKDIEILPTEANGRAFNAVPGFEFIPFSIEFSDEISVKISSDENSFKGDDAGSAYCDFLEDQKDIIFN